MHTQQKLFAGPAPCCRAIRATHFLLQSAGFPQVRGLLIALESELRQKSLVGL